MASQLPLKSCVATGFAVLLVSCFQPPSRVALPRLDPVASSGMEQRIALGHALFFDPILSRRGTQSCATCHKPEVTFSDTATLSKGDAGRLLKRHTPHLVNLRFQKHFFWDGRATTLEEQALMPIENVDEMDLPKDSMVARLKGHPIYGPEFEKLHPGKGVSEQAVARALAEYQRTLIYRNSPYDRWVAGDNSALDANALRGKALFEGKARCVKCHMAPFFMDNDFHNNGVNSEDPGRHKQDRIGMNREFEPTPYPFLSTLGAFKTPSLRQATLTAPYMHDGSVKTLEAVVDFYNRGGDNHQKRSKEVVPLHLTEAEKADLISFVRALTDTTTKFAAPEPRRITMDR